MKPFSEKRPLGRSGLVAGPLGVSGGYGAPAAAFEAAFERGCNYFYHGSIRRPGMSQAIKNLTVKGLREKLVVVDQIYTRSVLQFRWSFGSFLKKTGLEYADVLLLGWYNSAPSKRIMDHCLELKQKGLVRHLAISGHKRKAFPGFADIREIDVMQFRYNAVNKGAEEDIFPHLKADRPGTVAYTATCWGKLLNPKKVPAGEKTPRASDCYRFVLSNPNMDVCITGPSDMEQMKEALATLDRGPLSAEETAWMRRVGDHIHG